VPHGGEEHSGVQAFQEVEAFQEGVEAFQGVEEQTFYFNPTKYTV
jgi:hypothetical protein